MKEPIRKKYLTIRNNLANKEYLDNQIYERVINNKLIKDSNLILIYASYNSEVSTTKLIKYFLKDKQVALPKIVGNEMFFYYINSLDELEVGYLNIKEPSTKNKVTDFTNCVSLTPGICFSKDFYRLGYGKGFYDKFYSYHKDIYKIGLTYDECLLDSLPVNEYDIPVDEIITPTKTLVKK